MKKGFTITELLVAVALLAVVLAACGIIFNYSIDAQRTAGATAEIMRNLRVITDQLNTDFEGFTGLCYLGKYVAAAPPDVNAFVITFLTMGDFQTTGVYGAKNEPVRGNIARIYYGQSAAVSNGCPDPLSANNEDRRNKILARKQVILAPGLSAPTLDGYEEYENISLAEILRKCLHPNEGYYQAAWIGPSTRPIIDVGNQKSIRMYLVRGVDDFTITYLDDISSGKLIWRVDPPAATDERINTPALRFTFTLYDSKGIIKNGRKFEHIVYTGR